MIPIRSSRRGYDGRVRVTDGDFKLLAISHPVVELIRRRAEQRSEPGSRQDAHRLALVVEGGGMRGVVSAGMTSALERLTFLLQK